MSAAYIDYADDRLEDSSRLSHREITSWFHANIASDAAGLAAGGTRGLNSFPGRLYRILSNPDLSDVVRWMEHGRAWKVLRPQAFAEEVLPSYSSTTKYPNFLRQVNAWGFRRVKSGRDKGCYFHEMFLRSKPHLVGRMKKPKGKPQKLKATDGFPNFYAMPFLPQEGSEAVAKPPSPMDSAGSCGGSAGMDGASSDDESKLPSTSAAAPALTPAAIAQRAVASTMNSGQEVQQQEQQTMQHLPGQAGQLGQQRNLHLTVNINATMEFSLNREPMNRRFGRPPRGADGLSQPTEATQRQQQEAVLAPTMGQQMHQPSLQQAGVSPQMIAPARATALCVGQMPPSQETYDRQQQQQQFDAYLQMGVSAELIAQIESSLLPFYEWSRTLDEQTHIRLEYHLPLVFPLFAWLLGYSARGFALCCFIYAFHTAEVLVTDFGPRTSAYCWRSWIGPDGHRVLDTCLFGGLSLLMFVAPEEFGPFATESGVVLSLVLLEYLPISYNAKLYIGESKATEKEGGDARQKATARVMGACGDEDLHEDGAKDRDDGEKMASRMNGHGTHEAATARQRVGESRGNVATSLKEDELSGGVQSSSLSGHLKSE